MNEPVREPHARLPDEGDQLAVDAELSGHGRGRSLSNRHDWRTPRHEPGDRCQEL